jgi:hypothetical protein
LGTGSWESKLELLHSCVPKLELGNKRKEMLDLGNKRKEMLELGNKGNPNPSLRPIGPGAGIPQVRHLWERRIVGAAPSLR